MYTFIHVSQTLLALLKHSSEWLHTSLPSLPKLQWQALMRSVCPLDFFRQCEHVILNRHFVQEWIAFSWLMYTCMFQPWNTDTLLFKQKLMYVWFNNNNILYDMKLTTWLGYTQRMENLSSASSDASRHVGLLARTTLKKETGTLKTNPKSKYWH